MTVQNGILPIHPLILITDTPVTDDYPYNGRFLEMLGNYRSKNDLIPTVYSAYDMRITSRADS